MGVDHEEWDELIGRGRAGGAVHAEDVAHVLRHVELTSEVLVEVPMPRETNAEIAACETTLRTVEDLAKASGCEV